MGFVLHRFEMLAEDLQKRFAGAAIEMDTDVFHFQHNADDGSFNVNERLPQIGLAQSITQTCVDAHERFAFETAAITAPVFLQLARL